MRLKELRELKWVSAKELAREIGLPYTTYQNYEIGRNEPTLETLSMLADYFNVSIDYLIERDTNNLIGYLTEDQTEIVKALLQLTNRIRLELVHTF